MASLQINENFFSHVYNVIKDPAEAVEATLMAGFLGFEIFNITASVANKNKATALLDSDPQKPAKVWEANKSLVLSSSSLLSTLAMTFGWLNRVKIIFLGFLGPSVLALGYLSRSIISSCLLWDNVKRLDQNIVDFNQIKDASCKNSAIQIQIQNMLKIALYASSVAWGILGSVYAFTNDPTLFFFVDKLFCSAAIVFLALVTHALILLPKQKAQPSS